MRQLTSRALETRIEIFKDRVRRTERRIESIKHDNRMMFDKKKPSVYELHKIANLNVQMFVLSGRLKNNKKDVAKIEKVVPDKYSIGHISGFRYIH